MLELNGNYKVVLCFSVVVLTDCPWFGSKSLYIFESEYLYLLSPQCFNTVPPPLPQGVLGNQSKPRILHFYDRDGWMNSKYSEDSFVHGRLASVCKSPCVQTALQGVQRMGWCVNKEASKPGSSSTAILCPSPDTTVSQSNGNCSLLLFKALPWGFFCRYLVNRGWEAAIYLLCMLSPQVYQHDHKPVHHTHGRKCMVTVPAPLLRLILAYR